jgi:excisionase family DNA binding protein
MTRASADEQPHPGARSPTRAGTPRPLLLRIRDVAGMLSMSESATYDLVYKGELPSVYIGSARRVRMSDLEAYIAGLPSNSA